MPPQTGIDRHAHLKPDPADFVVLKDAARYFPRPNGKRISIQTLYRWGARGVRGVRLRTIRLGQQLCTCEAWVLQFIADLNKNSAIADAVSASKQEQDRRRQIDERLDHAGF